MQEKVRAWIEQHFDISSITIEEYPLLPGGHLITDKDGKTMVVFYDILADEIKYRIHDHSVEEQR